MRLKILYFDNYDSFASLIKERFVVAGADVDIYKSDADVKEAYRKSKPDAILLGPGPNGPRESGNYMPAIDELKGIVPILGICLGHQAIIEYFGGKIIRLDEKEVLHGEMELIPHKGTEIFKGIQDEKGINRLYVARYNSLGAYEVPSNLEVIARNNDGQVMAVKHRQHDIYGLQFHPESHLSTLNDAGSKLIKNIVEIFFESSYRQVPTKFEYM